MQSYRQKCESAHQILGLKTTDKIDEKLLKRCYYKEALRHHPDKNTSQDSHKKFQELSNAYEFVRQHHGFADGDEGDEELKEEPDSESSIPNMFTNYANVLFSFLSPMLESDLFQDAGNRAVYIIIENILNRCEDKALKMLDRLNRQQCGKICDILRSQGDVLHIPATFIEKMEILYKEKIDRDGCVIIYPTLDDLYAENLYKLEEGSNTYYIPLWYHELVYDNSGAELYVQCIPKLDDGVEIDEKNDIHITKQYSLSELWNMPEISIGLGKKTVRVDRERLTLTRQQTIKLVGAGISKMNTNNIYDVSKKSTVYIHVQISD